jgi:hypothetical protein
MTHKPHDALFRATFEQPEHASAALRGLLPPALVARVDWGSLALEASGLISDELGELVVDLLYSVQLVSNKPAFVYVLYEHQSSVDPRMALRVLEYMVAIWKRVSREHPPATPLLPIIPVVLYHGETGWTERPRSMGSFSWTTTTPPPSSRSCRVFASCSTTSPARARRHSSSARGSRPSADSPSSCSREHAASPSLTRSGGTRASSTPSSPRVRAPERSSS